jgi:multidrug efflux pump subunit AcrB
VGSPFDKVDAVKEHLEGAARFVAEKNGGDDLVLGTYSTLEGNRAETRVYLAPPGVRPISTTAFASLWRDAVGEVAGVDSIRFESDRGGPGRGPSLTVELSHSDIPTLERAAAHLGSLLQEFPSVSDVDDGFQEGKEQLDFKLKPEGRSLGLTSSEVARQVRFAFEGALPIRQQRGRNEVKVRVILPESQRGSEYDIEQLMIRTPAGENVPLRQIAEVDRGRAYTSIQRTDGRRTLAVSGNVTPDEMTNQVTAALTDDILPQLMRDFPGLSWSFGGRQSDMRESLASLGSMFIFALLGVYVLLAIPFHSYSQPLVVMVAIPFGIVGAIWGHLLMGYSLSVISMMGIMALSGVVINDALVMIVYANGKRSEGLSAFDAIHVAGVRRFRPILLTTMTTFGGLAPMIFETSRQARFMIPMAVSLGYGLLFATSIILLLVPSLYMILEDFKHALARFGSLLMGGTKTLGHEKAPTWSQ